MFRFGILLKKEFLQFFRNVALLIIVLYCCTLDIYMASEFSMDLTNYPVAIYDMDKTTASRELVSKIRKPYFIIKEYIQEENEVDRLILEGKVGVVVVIPYRFQDKLDSGRSAPLQIILDATTSNTAEMAANYIYQIVSHYSANVIGEKWNVSNSIYDTSPVISCRTRYEFNQNLDDHWSMCLSEFFSVITLIGMLLTATAMVNEKQFGTIEQLMVTPLKPMQIMLAKIIPMVGIFMVASFISVYCIMLPAVGMPLRGSYLDFLLLTMVFCFTLCGMGLLIATVSQNLSQTVLLTILILFPMMFLSGAWVPPEALPVWMQYLIYLSPMKYYIDIGMAIFFKGNSLFFMWQEFLMLLGLGLILFYLGAVRFRKMFG
ncbi:MAG: ABC transporter permease [Armatimonadota bacterium]